MHPLSKNLPRTLCLGALLAAGAAHAHTPYLLPNMFHTSARTATISADISLTDEMFLPDVAWGQHPVSLTGPDGKVRAVPQGDVHLLATRTAIEHKLGEGAAGTWRISAGPRVGAAIRSWEVDGKLERSFDPKAPMPAGAVLKSHRQSITLSEAFVTVGDQPDDGALKARGKGLEVLPLGHPNRLSPGTPFTFAVHHDGKPLPAHKVTVVYSNMDFSGHSSKEEIVTDAEGKASYTPQNPGVYMTQVSYSVQAPLEAEKPQVRHAHTLTFHVGAAQPKQSAAAGH